MKQPDDEYTKLRREMVDRQLAARGITDQRVLAAMAVVPRHRFVSRDLWDIAYRDSPLPLGYGQTISQPYIVAYMIQALHLLPSGEVKVLEIGTGSGYQAAILSRLVSKVYSVERLPELAGQARQCLADLGYDNVEINVGDGGYGWEEHSPYDGIIVAAAAPEVPAPLVAQLKDGAALVAPIGPMGKQELVRVRRRQEGTVLEYLAPVAFVPLIGEHGWSERSQD
ncbi:MAG: protein-L-isoaspartate(D-aspartate) O-methyltransferase [Anaerolineae bacterium]